MKFPKTGGRQAYRVTIPKLNGGMNGCDAEQQVEDNQLTDAMNMWWKDGALRTRPGVNPALSSQFYTSNFRHLGIVGGSADISGESGHVRKVVKIFSTDGYPYSYNLVLSTIDYTGNETRSTIMKSTNRDLEENGSLLLVESSGRQWEGTAANCAIAFVNRSATGAENVLLAEPSTPNEAWIDVKSEVYIPLVMVNGVGSDTLEKASSPGTLYEGYNLLTPKFRAQFTTTESARYYFLPQKKLDNSEIVVSCTNEKGIVTTYKIPAGRDKSEYQGEGALCVNRTGGYIYVVDTMGTVRWFSTAGIHNNLEVTASKTHTGDEEKILGMRFCTWFGGDRSGYNGGTRLFVAGNPQKPNLVHWSDVNNPLYFPENNYAYIGDVGQAVTAFAKQGEKLVIFKEREMYYTTYTAGSFSTQDVIDGRVVDVAANAAHFPVTQLHPFIGCDCPHTIQLCDNRLVWTVSNGKVYALAGADQYSENNVRELSRNIERWLSKKSKAQLQKACSGDYGGQYILMVGNDMFLFDYRDTSYISYVVYSSSAKSQARIPWMRWNFDCGLTLEYMMASGDNLVLCGTIPIGNTTHQINAALFDGEDSRVVFKDGMFITEVVPIPCMLQTKSFDFSAPERRKDIGPLYIGLRSKYLSTVWVTYLTEHGETQDVPAIRVTGAGGMVKLTPHANRIQRFGLRINSSGIMAVSDMVLKYQVYGGGIR